ncbi:MAG TPA: hypothetical protein VIJ35_05055 [Bradyrhizobium sp.]|jgi:hypothetical protein
MIAHIIGIRLSHATDHERLTFRCFLEPWVTGYEPLEYLGCGLVVRRGDSASVEKSFAPHGPSDQV